VIDRFTSYTEISPSNTGAKIFFTFAAADFPALRAAMAPSKHGKSWSRDSGQDHPPAIELHISNRYFAVTGNRLGESPEELRLVDAEDILWIINEAGPAFVGNGKEHSSSLDDRLSSPPRSGDNSRSARAFNKGQALKRNGATFEEMVAALRADPDPETADWVREKGEANGQRELRRIWEKGGDRVEDEEEDFDAPPKGNGAAAPRVPAIIIERGLLHEAADQGLAALEAARVPFFTRNFELVRVCTVKAKAWDGEVIRVPGILPVKYPALRRAMSQSADWMRPGKKGPCLVDVPKDVVEQVGGMVDEWPFPPLTGMISTPTLRPDGTVVAGEGYDEKTGLFLTGLPDMPAIPDHPTQQDAIDALTLLLGLIEEFPFANNESRSVGLSCLITPIVRGATGPVPMHLIVKPKPGTGGSYLVDVASVIAIGERCPVVALGDSKHPEETEKRLISSALLGSPIIGIDNCRGTLEGDFLCQVTERPVMRLRPLGTSDSKQVPNSFTVFANGNNPSIADDMVRRTIRASMDANMEHPEDREFRSDPLAAVRQDRGRYIAAALTIVRAYLAAGKPDRLRPLPSYGGWSDLVRSALVCLGQGDPVATMQDTRAEDPKAEARTAIFDAWKTEIGLGDNFRYQTSDLIDLAQTEQGTALIYPRLYAALLKVAGIKDRIDAMRLGQWLRDNINAVVLDCKLTVDRRDKARPKWMIDSLTKPS
jgi:putative DNA primase/helicase